MNGSNTQKTCRNWLCTLNNPVINPSEFLELIYNTTKAVYVVGQLEKGKEGTKHIQFFVNFKDPQKMGRITKIDKRIHVEPVFKNNGADTYCMKTDSRIEGPWEFGKMPIMRQSKLDWAVVKDLAKNGKLDQIPEDIYCRYYSNFCKIAKDHLIPRDREIKAFWIKGKSGCGKSTLAHEIAKTHYEGIFYPKNTDKWWDGYKGQKCVIMDDIDKYNVELGGELKRWSDRFAINVNNKGGAVAAEWDCIIVTSQYDICEIWKDAETQDALSRRFKLVTMNDDHTVNMEEKVSTQKPIFSEFTLNLFK